MKTGDDKKQFLLSMIDRNPSDIVRGLLLARSTGVLAIVDRNTGREFRYGVVTLRENGGRIDIIG